tara:strand:- start:561 stop:998 length:438 start_codon:yes stop_codon:yes gene_type:complete
MIEIITILSERLENQAVEIAKLKADLEAETARSSKLRRWWDEETERADQLEVQNVETGKENDALKDERQSWEYERAALLNQVKDLKGEAGYTAHGETYGSVDEEVSAIIARRDNESDGPDDVDVERMQSTADHDPESSVGDEAYE